MRNIVISDHCQTNGVAAALAEMLPHDNVTGVPLPSSFGTPEEEFFPAISSADIWIHGANDAFVATHASSLPNRAQHWRLPLLMFDAFHPDTCLLQKISSRQICMNPAYNSVITAWAWQHGLLPQDVPALFNDEVFEALGYFDRWSTSVMHLQNAFETTGWADEFWRFFLNVKRTGCFMHTFNHPKVHVLVSLAKMLAVRLGAGEQVWARDIQVQDILAVVTWPIYPGVADALGLEGGHYHWRWHDKRFADIQAFAEMSYMGYARENLDPADVRLLGFDMDPADAQLLGLDPHWLDQVLGPRCGVLP